MKIRVFLADDHAVLRAGLRSLLEATGEMTIVGEAASGTETLDGIGRTRPDVAVLDLNMPEFGGVESAEYIHERYESVRVLMLSAVTGVEQVHRALRAGAAGYVAKTDAGTDLVEAIRKVHSGRRFLSPSIAESMVESYSSEVREKTPLESLSHRERQVLQLIAEGRSIPEIGKLISISPRTVETYRGRIYDKLGLKDTRELIVFAVKHGIASDR